MRIILQRVGTYWQAAFYDGTSFQYAEQLYDASVPPERVAASYSITYRDDLAEVGVKSKDFGIVPLHFFGDLVWLRPGYEKRKDLIGHAMASYPPGEAAMSPTIRIAIIATQLPYCFLFIEDGGWWRIVGWTMAAVYVVLLCASLYVVAQDWKRKC